jgi:translin
MINKKAFIEMRKKIEQFDSLREDLIKTSRDLLKTSKAAIYNIHRHKISDASKQLKNAKTIIKKMDSFIKKDVTLASVGAYSEALEEYVEAACYYNFIKNNKLPTAKELGVETMVYLQGVCDLVGELVRKAINSSIKGEFKTALKIRDFVSDIYGELMMFDFRNSPVRRKFDSIKYGLDKLENLILELKLKKKLK